MEALEVGKGVLGKRCGERRGRVKSWSSNSKCGNHRRSRLLGCFPGKMAVRLAAPLSLLPRREKRAALESRPPNSAVRPPRWSP